MRATLILPLVLAPAAAAQDAPEALTATYACEGGVALQVAYLNPSGGESLAVVAYAGALVPMKAGPTGSGVRYVAYGDSGLVWHTKGAEGFLARDAGASQETLVDGCREAG